MTIQLIGRGQDATGGMAIPIGVGIRPQTMDARQIRTLRAVAAAAALTDPASALKTVKQAREDPASTLKVNASALNPVLQAVIQAQQDPTGGPTADQQHRAVATAARADPRLVAIAAARLENNNAATSNAIKWAASLDVDLVERAAKVAARSIQLAIVPDTTTRLDQVEAALQSLDERVAALEKQTSEGAKSRGSARGGGTSSS